MTLLYAYGTGMWQLINESFIIGSLVLGPSPIGVFNLTQYPLSPSCGTVRNDSTYTITL